MACVLVFLAFVYGVQRFLFSTLLLANVSYLSWFRLVITWVLLLVHTVNTRTFPRAVHHPFVAVKRLHRFSHLTHEGCIFLVSHSYELTSTWKKKHVELKPDTLDKASALHISKGKLPFSFRFLVLVLNVCVRQPFCDAETFYLSSMGRRKKKEEASKCVFKEYMFLSCLVPPRISLVYFSVSSVGDL